MRASHPITKHRIEVDGLTLKCTCGWTKNLDYGYKMNEEAEKHYDENMPERFTMNRASKWLRNRIPSLI